MHPRLLRNMFVHHVGHHIHRLDPVKRRAAALGRACGMGRNAVKTEFGRTIGQAGLRGGAVFIIGVPMDRNIDIVEQPGPGHVDLARSAFFRRSAIQPDAARRAGSLEPVLDRNRSSQRSRAKQIVAAGMTSPLSINRIARCRGRLVYTGQRIHFRQNRNHRTARTVLWAPFGHKGSRNFGNACADGETFCGKLFHHQAA